MVLPVSVLNGAAAGSIPSVVSAMMVCAVDSQFTVLMEVKSPSSCCCAASQFTALSIAVLTPLSALCLASACSAITVISTSEPYSAESAKEPSAFCALRRYCTRSALLYLAFSGTASGTLSSAISDQIGAFSPCA